MIGYKLPIWRNNYPRSVTATLILWILLATPCWATTVIALIDGKQNRIILAADSMAVGVVEEESMQGVRLTDKTCKIFLLPGCAFAINGQIKNPALAFDVVDLASQACASKGSLRKKANEFVKVAQQPTAKLVQFIYDHDQKLFSEKLMAESQEILRVVFAGVQEGRASLFVRGFKVHEDATIEPVSQNIDEAKPGLMIAAIGFNDEIAQYAAAHHLGDTDLVVTAEKLVELEIAKHPDDVGEPISILEIDSAGQHWRKAGICGSGLLLSK